MIRSVLNFLLKSEYNKSNITGKTLNSSCHNKKKLVRYGDKLKHIPSICQQI